MHRWSCPQCGIIANVRKYPVRCSCGFVAENRDDIAGILTAKERKQVQLSSHGVPAAEVKQRLATCQECKHLMRGSRNRCELIDLGCSNTFKKSLLAKGNGCPEDKWHEVA